MDVFVLLLVVCLLLSLALFWRLEWFPLRPASSRGGVKRTRLHRLLKPRCPDDCPACRLTSAPSLGAGPAPVLPWREVKSRRGAPKRINTEGFACPNPKCSYYGNTDDQIHAAFWRWQAWPGRTHPNVSLSSLPHHLHFQAQHCPVPPENSRAADRPGAVRAGRRARPIGGSAGLRLSTSHDHHLVDSRWGTRTDLA